MLLMISVICFLTLFLLLYRLLSAATPAGDSIAARLKALDGADRAGLNEELTRPLAQRILAPFTGSMAAGLTRFTPVAVRRLLEARLTMAGGLGGLGVDGFLLLSGCCGLICGLLTVLVALLAGAPPGRWLRWLPLAVLAGGLGPYLLLARKIAGRKARIERDLPDALDLLTVSVEAGLGFDGAMAKLAEKTKGPLVEEFTRALQEMRVGVSRRTALTDLNRRCAVPDLGLFTTALIQADQLGVSIGNVLRVQAAAMRDRRRQRAQARAMKAPVKMLVPLVLFIFPTLFIILLGPAAIRIFGTLAGGGK